ncbi:MAG: short-chain dehydrogenase/reductase [Rhizobacter sp.]|nr:short-chain dehydrogenase/reductase [Rhizobacter sp.]
MTAAPTGLDTSEVPDYAARLRLDGRSFLVGGAGFGMGRQAAHALAQAGARVTCVDIVGERAAAVAAEVGGTACTADLTRAVDVQRAVNATLDAGGGLNGVVCVIGESRWRAVAKTPDEDWDWAFDQNLRHAFLLLRHAAPVLEQQGGGSFTFVSSISGTTSAPFHSGYGAAKAALIQLARSAAIELRDAGIRVNTVAPGPTATPRMQEAVGAVADGTLAGWGATADIAGTLLFLSSGLAGHVTGQTLTVDGGTTSDYPLPIPDALLAAARA